MNSDEYRDRMAATHQEFVTKVHAMLAAYGRTQTVFTDTLRAIDAHITEMQETDAELKRLILEQGDQLRDQATQLREIRKRQEGGQ